MSLFTSTKCHAPSKALKLKAAACMLAVGIASPMACADEVSNIGSTEAALLVEYAGTILAVGDALLDYVQYQSDSTSAFAKVLSFNHEFFDETMNDTGWIWSRAQVVNTNSNGHGDALAFVRRRLDFPGFTGFARPKVALNEPHFPGDFHQVQAFQDTKAVGKIIAMEPPVGIAESVSMSDILLRIDVPTFSMTTFGSQSEDILADSEVSWSFEALIDSEIVFSSYVTQDGDGLLSVEGDISAESFLTVFDEETETWNTTLVDYSEDILIASIGTGFGEEPLIFDFELRQDGEVMGSVSAVPTPGAYALFGLGGFLVIRRKR